MHVCIYIYIYIYISQGRQHRAQVALAPADVADKSPHLTTSVYLYWFVVSLLFCSIIVFVLCVLLVALLCLCVLLHSSPTNTWPPSLLATTCEEKTAPLYLDAQTTAVHKLTSFGSNFAGNRLWFGGVRPFSHSSPTKHLATPLPVTKTTPRRREGCAVLRRRPHCTSVKFELRARLVCLLGHRFPAFPRATP